MRVSGLVMHGDLARAASVDHTPDVVEIAINQVDLVAVDGEPAATDDPGTPSTYRRDFGGVTFVDKRPHGLPKRVRIDRLCGRIIESDVVVGRFVRCSPRA